MVHSGAGDSAMLGAGHLYGTDRPDATALAVTNDSITHIGNDAEVAERVDPGEGLDLRALGAERTLIAPAFVDAHLHTVQAGQIALGLDLHGVPSRENLLDRLAAHARSHSTTRIVVGQGWDERAWPDPSPPTRDELDRAGDGRLVYLARVDVHSAVVSSALLAELPEVAQAPGFRDDGLVSREAHHVCRGALDRFFTDGERRDAARITLRRCAELGVASVHDLGGPHLGPVADAVRVRETAAEIGLEVVGYWGELADPDTIRLAGEYGLRGLAGDLCIDGAIGSRTAALIEDYADHPSRGARYLSDDQIRDHVVTCTHAGLQAGFHCIGDDGVAAAVQGLRRAAEITGTPRLQAASHRLEHVEMVSADDFATLADLGVVASVQPGFDAAWGPPGELYEQRLGPARSRPMNPFGGLQRAGVTLAFGTDAPVTPVAGWAMVRQAVEHCQTDQRLDLVDAFAAATSGGHRAAGDSATGILARGRRALLAIWDVTGFEIDSSGLPILEAGASPAAWPWCWETESSVVREGTRGGHHAGADAIPVGDSEFGGGAPARSDRVVRAPRMLAGRAEICVDADVWEGGRDRIHIESVRPVIGPDGDRQGPPIRCQRKYPSVPSPYARDDTYSRLTFPVPRVLPSKLGPCPQPSARRRPPPRARTQGSRAAGRSDAAGRLVAALRCRHLRRAGDGAEPGSRTDSWPLLFVGVPAFTLAVRGVRRRRAFALGYLFGLAMLGVSISWIHVLGVWVAVALIAFEALFFAVLGLALNAGVAVPAGGRWRRPVAGR